MSEKIVFPTNVPVELSLQFLEGKPVPSQFGGNQHLFTTTDGRIFFVSETVGEILTAQFRKMHLQKGEPVEIIKAEVPGGNGRKSIQWIAHKVGSSVGEQGDGTVAVEPVSALERQLRQSIKQAAAANGASARTPAPVVAAALVTEPQQPSNGNGNKPSTKADGNRPETERYTQQGWVRFLLSQTNAVIDVYAAALHYASQKYGNAIKPEDVRALLTTAFINVAKTGGPHGA